MKTEPELITCPLCKRPIPKSLQSKHHLIPKSRGGKEIIILHKICHNKLHSTLSEKELEREYSTIDKLKTNPEIIKFVKWITKKPPNFYSRTRKKK